MKGKDKKTAPPLVNQTIFFNTKNSDVERFKKLPSGTQYCPQERIKSGLKYGQSKLAALLSEAGTSPVVVDTVNEPEVTQQEVDEAMEAELARQAAAQAHLWSIWIKLSYSDFFIEGYV